MQSMTAIIWPLLILTGSPELKAGMVKMWPRLPTKGLIETGEAGIQGTCPIQIFSCCPIPSFLDRGEFDALRLLV